ncbi:MAG: LysR family transcriptional regulator [Peptococcaceae bacterium]
MKLEQLEQLIQIYQWGSFNVAAQYLHMTHQNLSRSMQAFEQELGITIFSRSTKGTSLTTDGKIVYSFAIRVINEHKKMVTMLQASHQEQFQNNVEQEPYHLQIAHSAMLDFIVNPLLHNIAQHGHTITTQSMELNLSVCTQTVNDATYYDLIFLQEDRKSLLKHSKPASHYHLFILNIEKLELIANKTSPYAEYASIPRSSLESIPLLCFSHDGTISNVAQICLKNHIALNIVSYTNKISTSQELLLSGSHHAICVPSTQGPSFSNIIMQNNMTTIPIDIPIRIATAVYIKKDLCETTLGQDIIATLKQAYHKTLEQIY